MSRYEIKSRFTGAIIFAADAESFRACVEMSLDAGVDLSGADLSGADLWGADLSDAKLSGADLSRADLSRADLSRADLSGAKLSRAKLSRADLSGAKLSRADLSDAKLSRADLSRADLSDAKLLGADLSRADLSDAYLVGAYLADTERFRARNPGVPVIPNLDVRILAAIEAGGSLDMLAWHTCETTHCRAGWAIMVAGSAGAELEDRFGPERAARMIYRASTGRVPDFFASNADALADIREQAALQSGDDA